jgi:archaellum component FlaF (FlaF/FlaG flagellin family)
MGLSVSAATGIIVLAMVISVSFVGLTLAESFDKLRSSGEGRLSYLTDRQKTCIDIYDVNLTTPVLTVMVENCGSVTIDASEMTVLLDGVLVKPSGMKWNVSGRSTDLVLHGEILTIGIFKVVSMPSGIKVITGNGVVAYW